MALFLSFGADYSNQIRMQTVAERSLRLVSSPYVFSDEGNCDMFTANAITGIIN